MSSEWPNRRAHALEATDPLAAELHRLQQVVCQAFGLAKGGAVSRGYSLLREDRDAAARFRGSNAEHTAELLQKWDAATSWFERFAPSPLR